MVDVDDLGLDLVADGVGGLRVVDLVPGELALVHQAVDATQVDEDPEWGDAADGALDSLTDLEAAEKLVALLAALLVQGDLLGQDEPVRLAIDLEDLEAQGPPDERLQLLGNLLRRVARLLVARPPREVDDLADRHEAADAEVDDQATLVMVDDPRLDDLAGVETLLHGAPLPLEAGTPQGQHGMPLGRLWLQDVDQHLVADLELGARLVAVAWAASAHQLPVGDHSLALAAEVDKDLVGIDAHHGAFDDVTMLEALHLVRWIVEQLGHGHRLVRLGARGIGGRHRLWLDRRRHWPRPRLGARGIGGRHRLRVGRPRLRLWLRSGRHRLRLWLGRGRLQLVRRGGPRPRRPGPCARGGGQPRRLRGL